MVSVSTTVAVQARVVLESVSPTCTSTSSHDDVSFMVYECPLPPAHVTVSHVVIYWFDSSRWLPRNSVVISLDRVKLVSEVLEDTVGYWVVTVSICC